MELFNDCIDTYKRAYRLVDNNRLLDGIVLTRNAFELMIILYFINVIMILPMVFLEILNEEKIIDDDVFQDSTIFKYIVERLTLIRY